MWAMQFCAARVLDHREEGAENRGSPCFLTAGARATAATGKAAAASSVLPVTLLQILVLVAE